MQNHLCLNSVRHLLKCVELVNHHTHKENTTVRLHIYGMDAFLE